MNTYACFVCLDSAGTSIGSIKFKLYLKQLLTRLHLSFAEPQITRIIFPQRTKELRTK